MVRRAIALLVFAWLSASTAQAAQQRFALIVANDVGAPGHQPLEFAQEDAARLADVLVRMGDFPTDHVFQLHNGRPNELREQVRLLNQHLQQARNTGSTTLLFFYYSGHANPGGLELGPELFGYDELRKLLASSPASARIILVDACGGGLTNVKGEKGGYASSLPNFPLHLDDDTEGVAYISSSNRGEAAQESREIRGSFFTVNFVSALEGAGDKDRDGQVSLREAFEFASSQTLAATAATRIGPQHPNYKLDLHGQRDLVLAYVKKAEALLELPQDGRSLYVLTSPDGFAREIPGASSGLTLGLPAGTYTIERHNASGRQIAQVTLRKNDRMTADFIAKGFRPAGPKGEVPLDAMLQIRPNEVSLAVIGTSGPLRTQPFIDMLGAEVAFSHQVGAVRIRAYAAIAGGNESASSDPRFQYLFTQFGAGLGVRVSLWERGPLCLEVGGDLGGGAGIQHLPNGDQHTVGTGQLRGALAFTYSVQRFRFGPELVPSIDLMRVNDAVTFTPALDLGFGVAAAF